MQVLFNHVDSIFYSGKSVSGKVVLELTSTKEVRELILKVKGVAQIKWHDQGSRTHVDEKQTFFEEEANLGEEMQIPPGTHYFDFSIDLPRNLPSTYAGEFGSLHYFVKASLCRSWKFNQTCKAAFIVICPVDLNELPHAQKPLQLETNTCFGILCCFDGPVVAKLTAPYSGFTPGEIIPLTVHISNQSDTDVYRIMCYFRKIVTYRSKPDGLKYTMETKNITSIAFGSVEQNCAVSRFKNISVPSLSASTLDENQLIVIGYEFKLKLCPASVFYRKIEVIAPIIIGTVPFITNNSHSQPIVARQPRPRRVHAFSVPSVNKLYPGIAPPSFEQCTSTETVFSREEINNTPGALQKHIRPNIRTCLAITSVPLSDTSLGTALLRDPPSLSFSPSPDITYKGDKPRIPKNDQSGDIKVEVILEGELELRLFKNKEINCSGL